MRAVAPLFALTLLAPGHVLSAGLSPDASRIVECLAPQPERGAKPEYPVRSLERKIGGTVRVEMVFTRPDTPPEVEVLGPRPSDDLVDTVLAHVSRLRAPCLGLDEAAVRLRQDYVFVPNDGRKVVWTTPSESRASRDEPWSCLTHLRPDSTPEFPVGATRRRLQGTVLVRLRFISADASPEIDTVVPDPKRAFVGSVREWASGYRLPCLNGRPVSATQLFTFHMAGEARAVLQDASLSGFLRGVRNVSRQPVYFDFSTMGCPFDVRIKYLRPHLPNQVGEVEGTHPDRRPFLDWLATLTLDLPDEKQNAVLGDTMTIGVPCGTLDL